MAEGDKVIISRESSKFSGYFINIPILNIPNNGYKCPDSLEQDSFLKILGKYKDHPSIKLIKAKNNSQGFKFSQIDIKVAKNLSKVLTRKNSLRRMILETIC